MGSSSWFARRTCRGLAVKRFSIASIVVGSALALPVACGSEDEGDGGGTEPAEAPRVPTGDVTVSVSFPNEQAETVTASLHAWVLVPDADAGTTCAALIGGDADPYDLNMRRTGDAVSTDPAEGVTVEEVEVGRGLLYVEAVDFSGNIEYAGCIEFRVGQGANPAEIELQKARVFDCADEATEEGAPCDDGRICTTGETCDGGECQGGEPRDCDFLAEANDCQAARCDEELGCTSDPIGDQTPCEDDRACTENDVCMDGECVGTPVDCDAQAGQCQVSLGCDESLGCQFTDAPSGTVCDDGQFCTDNDQCDFFGTCGGTTRDCTAGGCQTGRCDETLDECVTTPVTAGTFCTDSDPCTSSDQCDGAGTCVGTPVDCSYLDSTCRVGVCDPTFGSCTTEFSPSGTACDDLDSCTSGDACNGTGSCIGTEMDCSSFDSTDGCILGICSGGTCTTTTATTFTPCDDGDCSTTGEYCSGGTCGFGTPTTCPDGGL